VSEAGATETIYRLRVVLAQVSPLTWRRLEVASSITLTGQHEVLQAAFGWNGDYLHAFTVHGVDYGTTSGAHRRGDQVRLVDLRLRERERFVYGYNFFAGWYHDVLVEAIGPTQPRRRYPRCVAGARAVPPDGCDGPDAYLDLRANRPTAVLRIAEILGELLDEHLDDRLCDVPELREELHELAVYARDEHAGGGRDGGRTGRAGHRGGQYGGHEQHADVQGLIEQVRRVGPVLAALEVDDGPHRPAPVDDCVAAGRGDQCAVAPAQPIGATRAASSSATAWVAAGEPDAYRRLAPALNRPIRWDIIAEQYDQMIKYATAVRAGTASTEAILRRFQRTNSIHPTYQAMIEVGRAQRTIFVARYLRDRDLQREINEGLNVVESWNRANSVIFFGKGGDIATNRRDEQELSTRSACPRRRPSTPGSPGARESAPGGTRSWIPTTRRTPARSHPRRLGGRRTAPPHREARRGHGGTGLPVCRTSTTARTPTGSARACRQSALARHPAASSARQAHRDPVIGPRPDIIARLDAPPLPRTVPGPVNYQDQSRLDLVTRLLPARPP
jgi:hypothetical protein